MAHLSHLQSGPQLFLHPTYFPQTEIRLLLLIKETSDHFSHFLINWQKCMISLRMWAGQIQEHYTLICYSFCLKIPRLC